MAEKTIWARASELAKNSKVTVRISQIKSELAAAYLWTRLQSIKTLAKIAEEGMTDSARIAAIKELNVMHGFNEPKKVELSGKEKPLTLLELYAQMKTIDDRR